jgi:hypothetical protein
MGSGEKVPLRRQIGLIGVAALVALLTLGVASPAVAKKKKKSNPAVSTTASAPFTSGTSQSLSATCSKGTHISGGGFAVSPNYVPGGGLSGTGVRAGTATSKPDGAKTWNAATSAWVNPSASGSFSTVARCERDTLGKLTVALSSAQTFQPGQGNSLILNCPGGSHVIAGGYAGNALGSITYVAASFRIILLQSQRTGPGQWTVTAADSQQSPDPATITAYALCEKNAKGTTVSEVGTTVPISENQRSTADATCTGKTHVISGGFALSPIPTVSGNIPVTEIDEFQPTSKKTWHLGLWEAQGYLDPPGSSLREVAYCKKDAAPRKKK